MTKTELIADQEIVIYKNCKPTNTTLRLEIEALLAEPLHGKALTAYGYGVDEIIEETKSYRLQTMISMGVITEAEAESGEIPITLSEIKHEIDNGIKCLIIRIRSIIRDKICDGKALTPQELALYTYDLENVVTYTPRRAPEGLDDDYDSMGQAETTTPIVDIYSYYYDAAGKRPVNLGA